MQLFYLTINFLVVASMLFLGLMVLKRDYKSRLTQAFFGFALSLAIWIPANYISNIVSLGENVSKQADYFVFCFSFLAAFCLLWFSLLIADDTKWRKLFYILSPLLIIVSLLSFTPLIVSGVQLQGDVYAVEFGSAISIYGICLILMIVATLATLLKNIFRSTGLQRQRLKILFISLVVVLPIVLFTGFILPSLTGWFGLTNLGPLPMIILAIALYYSALKHKTFDLRLVIARSLAYIFTIGVVMVVYSTIAFSLVGSLTGVKLTLIQKAFLILVTLVIAISFAPIRSFFNKITDSLFYRDKYDAEALLNKLNAKLVRIGNLDQLVEASIETIEQGFRPQYMSVSLTSDQDKEFLYNGASQLNLSEADLAGISQVLNYQRNRSLITEDLSSAGQKTFQKLLNKHQIALVSKLMSGDHLIGYIILGDKKSGNSYSRRDIQLIETAADSIAIAAQNALRYEQIAAFNITLQKRIEAATRQLKRSNVKLQELDDAKDEFISMASHQLRTPLTSIKGYISMILEGDAGKILSLIHI